MYRERLRGVGGASGPCPIHHLMAARAASGGSKCSSGAMAVR